MNWFISLFVKWFTEPNLGALWDHPVFTWNDLNATWDSLPNGSEWFKSDSSPWYTEN